MQKAGTAPAVGGEAACGREKEEVRHGCMLFACPAGDKQREGGLIRSTACRERIKIKSRMAYIYMRKQGTLRLRRKLRSKYTACTQFEQRLSFQ
jgi:hypothetical protein